MPKPKKLKIKTCVALAFDESSKLVDNVMAYSISDKILNKFVNTYAATHSVLICRIVEAY